MDDAGDDCIKDPTAFTALTKIHKGAVLDCCFALDTDQILSASEDSSIVLWNLPPPDTELHDETLNDEHKLVCYRLSNAHKTPVMSVAMHKKVCLSASKDGIVNLWRLVSSSSSSSSSNRHNHYHHPHQTFKQISPEPSTYNCITRRIIRSICFAPDGYHFATGSDDGNIRIWATECRNKLLISLLDGHNNWIKCVRWSYRNDSLLASCGDDGKLCIWDARTKIRQPPCGVVTTRQRMQFNCLAWHPVFEHYIATGAQNSSCIVWDLRNSKQIQIYEEHDDSINSIAFNPGGSLLLTGSSDETSKIFDVCEGKNLFTLKSHNAPINSVCFDSTGDLFATGSKDKTLTVWKRNFDTISIVQGEDESEEQYESVNNYAASDVGSSIPSEQSHTNHHYMYAG